MRSRSGSCGSSIAKSQYSNTTAASSVTSFEQRYQIAQWKKQQKIKQVFKIFGKKFL